MYHKAMGALNSSYDVPTPRPDSNWLKLSPAERISTINNYLAKIDVSSDFLCIKTLDSGEIVLRVTNNIPVERRIDCFLDLELKIKLAIDEGLFISCEPIGDRNSLRNLRGINIKEQKQG